MTTITTSHIFENDTLFGIYQRAVKKFMKRSNDEVIFFEMKDYISRQLDWKKQDVYLDGLPMLKALCEKFAIDFDDICKCIAPEAPTYRDLFFEIFE